MKRNKYYIMISILLFIGYAIYYSLRSSNLLAKGGKYTIATVKKIEAAGNGIRIYLYFFYEGTRKDVDYIEQIDYLTQFYVGKRFIIKFIPNNDRAIRFNMDCVLPDSIQSAPSDGWSQEWIQKNFPNCVK
jgi:hypothetical protein